MLGIMPPLELVTRARDAAMVVGFWLKSFICERCMRISLYPASRLGYKEMSHESSQSKCDTFDCFDENTKYVDTIRINEAQSKTIVYHLVGDTPGRGILSR